MKAILQFNLDNPEDKEQHEIMLKANDMRSALSDIAEKLRHIIKRSELSKEQFEFIDKFQDEFYEILAEHDIKL